MVARIRKKATESLVAVNNDNTPDWLSDANIEAALWAKIDAPSLVAA